MATPMAQAPPAAHRRASAKAASLTDVDEKGGPKCHGSAPSPSARGMSTTPRGDESQTQLPNGAGRLTVDAGVRTSRRPHADARLCGDARGRDGGVRQELGGSGGRYGLGKKTVAYQ